MFFYGGADRVGTPVCYTGILPLGKLLLRDRADPLRSTTRLETCNSPVMGRKESKHEGHQVHKGRNKNDFKPSSLSDLYVLCV